MCFVIFCFTKWKVCSDEAKNLVYSSFETRVVDLEFSGFFTIVWVCYFSTGFVTKFTD